MAVCVAAAVQELLKSQGYRDPEEVQREVNEEKEKIKRDLEKKMQDVQDQEKIRFEDEKKRVCVYLYCMHLQHVLLATCVEHAAVLGWGA